MDDLENLKEMAVPNSNKYKQEKKEEKKNIKPVVTNEVKKKKNIMRQASNSIIGEEFKNVKNYVLTEVLLPSLKKAISDIVTNGIDMLLYGETGKSKRKSGVSNISYTKYYDRNERYADRYSRPRQRARVGYDYDDIIMQSRGEAEDVLQNMDALLDQYGTVSVADFYDLVGISGSYTDNKYGWISLASADIVRVRDGYILKLPKALPFD